MLEVPKRCNGCHACASICPQKCIKMVANDEGFLYPQIDKTRCVKCGLCIKTCPLLHKQIKRQNKPQRYACFNKDINVRMQSSSGGIFTLLAEEIIKGGGHVFGAAFDENLKVKHICVSEISQLQKLRGSKYVQSEIGDCFLKARTLLNEGKKVLFTGTPCQIGGLKNFLGKDYDNLWLQDIICHGVPSPLAWEKYKEHLSKSFNSNINKVAFRDKSTGWLNYSMKIDFENGQSYKTLHGNDEFFKIFLKDVCLRNSCYDCAFKGEQRASDITLADFWGADRGYKKTFDDKGLSYVVIHTQKGMELFNKIKDKIVCMPAKVSLARRFNKSYSKSCKRPLQRDLFMKELQTSEFDKAFKCLKKI